MMAGIKKVTRHNNFDTILKSLFKVESHNISKEVSLITKCMLEVLQLIQKTEEEILCVIVK